MNRTEYRSLGDYAVKSPLLDLVSVCRRETRQIVKICTFRVDRTVILYTLNHTKYQTNFAHQIFSNKLQNTSRSFNTKIICSFFFFMLSKMVRKSRFSAHSFTNISHSAVTKISTRRPRSAISIVVITWLHP